MNDDRGELPMLRVLIAEDSAVTREYLVHVLRQDGDVAVVGTACDGIEAVRLAERLKPDVILMDARMPCMDGYQATRAIMARAPTRIIMVTASFDSSEVSATFAALDAGALTILGKPRGVDDPRRAATARALVDTVKLMAEVKVVGRRLPPAPPLPPELPPLTPGAVIRLVAMGASTGGPPAVAEVLRQLPKRVPVLIVQHIATGFIGGFAEWLRVETGFATKLAERHEHVCAGVVYVAPHDTHIEVTKDRRINLTNGAATEGFRPSISHLFETVALAYGRTAAGVLLSGMGRDGAMGLRALRIAGAVTFAQDEASCAVFGMPREAVRLGAAEYVLSPTEIGRRLRARLADEKGVRS